MFDDDPSCCSRLLTFSGICVANAACSAACGATSGAVGFSVMQAAGWTVAGINYTNFVQAMAAGAAVLSPLSICCTAPVISMIGDRDARTAMAMAAAVPLCWSDVTGALAGMAGANMLQLLTSGAQVGFAAGAGAAGAAIVVTGSVLVIVCAACVGGPVLFCCCGDKFGQAKLLRLPSQPGEKPEIVDPSVIGLDVTTAVELQQVVSAQMAKQSSNASSAPKQDAEMSRLTLS